ncbi:MAG TPA: beta-ketoacyl reductase, partial [Longimicrobiaceae bacterium]|nr:beta-ketoacyl reductase [Longimicrobiaceae bacterium]
HHRRAAGHPALSIGWGVWSQIGSAAERGMAERVASWGAGAIAPEEGLRVLELLVSGERPYVAVQPIDWSSYLSAMGEVAPWLSEVAHPAAERNDAAFDRGRMEAARQKAAAQPPLLARLAAAAPGDQRELLMAHVHEQVVRVIGLGAGEKVDPRQPLSDLGIDSLMALELRNRLGPSVGAQHTLPATLVFDHPTITALTQYLAREVLALDWAAAAATPAAQPADLLNGIESLSDEEVERLFAGIEKA